MGMDTYIIDTWVLPHMLLYLDKPTIGVAKSYLKINDVDFTMLIIKRDPIQI